MQQSSTDPSQNPQEKKKKQLKQFPSNSQVLTSLRRNCPSPKSKRGKKKEVKTIENIPESCLTRNICRLSISCNARMPEKSHIKVKHTGKKIPLLLIKPFTGGCYFKWRILRSAAFADITPPHEGLLCKASSQKAV